MSTLKVEVAQITDISVHPNADRLQIAQLNDWDWPVVIAKDSVKIGDKCVYLPVDAVLPEDLRIFLFPEDSKIKLTKSRIRSIKIRGALSQGMIVGLEKLKTFLNNSTPNTWNLGEDVSGILNITKYEPPEENIPSTRSGQPKKLREFNPNFSKYTNIENWKYYAKSVLTEGEMINITEKLHGTSARYGYVEKVKAEGFKGFLQSLLWKIRPLSRFEFVVGSRNIELKEDSVDVYNKIALQENMRVKLRAGECIYGEIVGANIQKGYSYGCKPGEHKFYAYDVKVNGKYLNPREFLEFCIARNFTTVPQLYNGPFTKEIVEVHTNGDSTIGNQKVREGCVIKPEIDRVGSCGRVVLKSISEAYLLDDTNTDFH